MPTALSIVLIFFSLFLVRLLLGPRRVTRDVGKLSGQFFLISPLSVEGFLVARMVRQIPYLHAGTRWALGGKHEDFVTARQDAFAVISALPVPKYMIHIADAAAIKEVTTYRARFPKPMHLYKVVTVFGANIVASEGEEWKKYRKIGAPAFAEKNNKLVWDETTRVMVDMFDNVWGDKSEVIVDHCVDITLPIALFIISVAGFGRRVTWTSDLVVPPGHQMTFRDALHILSSNMVIKIAVPYWAKYLTKHTRKIDLAFKELKQYLVEMVEARRYKDKVEERYDLFSSLLDATQDELGSEAALDDEELIGNMFIYLLAGHETAAYTLCFSFALLALYPDEQERLYQHIKGVMSNLDGMPAYEDINRFTQSLTVFYETLRLFPPVTSIPKVAAQDITLTVSNIDGGKTTFPVPSGTEISLHVPGLHYNPVRGIGRSLTSSCQNVSLATGQGMPLFHSVRVLALVWEDGGSQYCGVIESRGLTRFLFRFFEAEGVAALTMLVSRYKIEVKEEPEFAGETFEERYARMTAFHENLTTTPLRVPLVFKRR